MSRPQVRLEDFIAQMLDDDGDGTGETNASANYSSAEEIFFFKPTRHALIARMIVHVRDGGAWRAERYGSIGTLSTGVGVRVSNDDGVVINLDGGERIKSNAAWGHVCYDIRIETIGPGETFMSVRWTFEKSGIPLALDPDRGEKLEVTLNDNLSQLSEHHFMIQGRYG